MNTTWEENNKGNLSDSLTPVQIKWTIVFSAKLSKHDAKYSLTLTLARF